VQNPAIILPTGFQYCQATERLNGQQGETRRTGIIRHMDYRLRKTGHSVRGGRHWSSWLWRVAIAVVTGGLLFGIFTNKPWALERAAWQWEQIRGMARDAVFRRMDTVPVAAGDAIPEIPHARSLPVTASYASSVVGTLSTPNPTQESVVQATPNPLTSTANYAGVAPPKSHQLAGFRHVYQTPNNCGPATLGVALSYYDWHGNQKDIAGVLKPQLRDKNVRGDEMVYYVRNHAGWLNALFRVGGDIDLLERFISNGYPVIMETGYEAETGWVGHYLLATGYDRATQMLTVQDVTAGPNQEMLYDQVDTLWRQFNRMYILVFPASEWNKIELLLAEHATPDANRLQALHQTLADTENRPEDAFAWFAHGSNLTYFSRYHEASRAYDRAIQIGLPWRMLFYQFGPYIAYFNVGRYQDVVELATTTLQARPDLEESYVWRGWARHMLGDSKAAVADFKSALRVNPNFLDANTGLQALGEQ